MYTKQAEFKAGLVVLLAIAGLLVLVWFAAGAESIFGDWRFGGDRSFRGLGWRLRGR